jgi:acetyl esterase/lipase
MWQPPTLEDLLSPRAFEELHLHHPLVSPAALMTTSSLRLLLPEKATTADLSEDLVDSASDATLLAAATLRPLASVSFLIHHGSAEMLTDECAYLVSRLRAGGSKVEEKVLRGGVHVEPLFVDREELAEMVQDFIRRDTRVGISK